jgi:predicted AAA+ superfamily ATPase
MAEVESHYPRRLQRAISAALADTPVVAIIGPRQCGKSTLAKTCSPSRSYVSLDDAAMLRTARDDPTGFVASLPDPVTLDEVQRAPDLFRAIKGSVDRDRRPGRFLLTGSADLLLLPQLSDSLAGRIEFINLHPLTESEKRGPQEHFSPLYSREAHG